MAADFRVPEALTSGSLLLPFMGLTGLDTTHNAVHRTIWEVFKDSRKDGKHKIHYRTFPLDHIYPKPSRDFVVRLRLGCCTHQHNTVCTIGKGEMLHCMLRSFAS